MPVLLMLLMLPLGALRFEAEWSALTPLPEQNDVKLQGRIAQVPVFDMDEMRTVCVLEDILVNGECVSGQIRLYLRGDEILLQSISLGQSVSCEAHIWRDEGATNPGQFNFSNYLRLNGLRAYATAQIEDATFSRPEFRPGDWRIRLLSSLGERVDRLFPQNAPLARAFLLGDRSRLSDEDRENYNRCGAAHLLAISGMHISVLAMAVSLLMGSFLHRNRAFALTLFLMILYGALIGFSASLFRAILMFGISGAAPLAGRYSDGPTRLSAAMLLYLSVRPQAVIEASFLLSYGACAGIFLLNAPLQRLVHAREYLQKNPGRGMKALLLGRIPRWIVQMLIVTAAAQLAVLPAIVHFFGAQPLYSFIANLFTIPLAMAGYLTSIVGLLTGLYPIAMISDYLFGLLNSCVAFFGTLPLASLSIARFPILLSVSCALICLLSSDLSRLPEKLRRYLPLTILLAALISNLLAYSSTRNFSIVFLDSGQADCAVVRTQGKVYLIDTGDSFSPAPDYLSAKNYSLEGIFLSHAHTDHAGGLDGILDVCVPKRIYLSAQWTNEEVNETVASALARAKEMGSEIVVLSSGDSVDLSEKTSLKVLSPSAGISTNSANENSMVLRIEYGAASAVFCGDAPADRLLGLIGDIDLLKVPHHGGSDSLTPSLLAETTPSVAIIPVGVNNYGHPAKETLDLLSASEAYSCRLNETGAVICRFKEDGTISLRTYRSSEKHNGLE